MENYKRKKLVRSCLQTNTVLDTFEVSSLTPKQTISRSSVGKILNQKLKTLELKNRIFEI